MVFRAAVTGRKHAAAPTRGGQQPGHMNVSKYTPYEPLGLDDRTWPARQPVRAPLWASVDLRDGNQALIDPMDLHRRRAMFDLLVSLGFKEIEVGYPMASRGDHEFIRHLAETGAIPDDVTVQVLTPIIDGFIERTVASLAGTRRAILQIFVPTSESQRRLVLHRTRNEVKAMALAGAEEALRLQDSLPDTDLFLQYAPESFTQTEPDFALEICNQVLEFWQPRAQHTLAVNLPATVEVYPPQEFADRIEYMSRNLVNREQILLSVHPHNDRGSAVAAAEMAVLAGADRVEGTLFGNGERTGNVCLVTLAMNLFSQGIDPMLDLSDLDAVRRTVEECNQMPVSHRHPWAGDFVYTSFAGTHQDAIAKGLRARGDDPHAPWDVPYLPIDPRDIGRDYQALIRINSQSGKGGIAHLLRTTYGLELPRRLQIDFAAAMQRECEAREGEIGAAELWRYFEGRYMNPAADTARRPSTAFLTADEPAELAGHLLTAYGVDGALRELALGRAGAGREDSSACCEVTLAGRSWWGVALADSPNRAVEEAVRSIAGQLARSNTPHPRDPGAAGTHALTASEATAS